MSLLDKANESVVVYPEEVVTDADGNTKTRPAKVGFPARAMVRSAAQSGTSARRTEQDNEGYESEQLYRVRFLRGFNNGVPLGAQSQIEWNGQRWALFGDAVRFNGSRRTAHLNYLIRRF
ncbi:hypothetical protein NONI108955_08890 [Nocardia ninae]|uniref:Head-to-tail stopper n=1 Tax=Nocardia ninae NBRC 108245 TaxID=1210091 RepID=A0A511MJN8_9NOCA|nr:hypothetical protein [Nocardia ninae]GEM40852.1 hypothetical protein NN4_53710 [Nocardia ninae NBRC 108245]